MREGFGEFPKGTQEGGEEYRGSMTKKELIKLLKGLPDNTRIYVPSLEFEGSLTPAVYVDICNDGSDGSVAKVEIVGEEIIDD